MRGVRIKKILVVGVIAISLIWFSAAAGIAQGAEVNPKIPGEQPEEAGPAGIIGNLYQFALMIGGLLAFGAIVWGAIERATAGGNTSKIGDANNRITQALVGLLLLAGGALILTTIRPGFSLEGGEFRIPGIPGLEPPPLMPATPPDDVDCATGLPEGATCRTEAGIYGRCVGGLCWTEGPTP